MKRLLNLAISLMILSGCEIDRESVPVVYKVSGAVSAVSIEFRDQDGNLQHDSLFFTSTADIWQTSVENRRGEIVYLSGSYADTTGSVKLMILLDGKIYKQASSMYEPGKVIVVSGSIPY